MKPALDVIGPEEVYAPARKLTDLAFTADVLAGEPAPPRPWHVPNMVPGKSVTLLQGDGGTGKSIVALQLAVATTQGARWLGQPTRSGNVLYVSAEDDRDEIHRRLDAVTTDYAIGFDQLTGLKVIDMTGEDALLAVTDGRGRLVATERWSELEAVIRAWEPALVVIDNLADVFGGEENSRPHARQFVAQLQGCAIRSNAAFVVIGHPSLAGMASGSGSSGSTAWNNSVRSRLYLTRPGDGENAATDARVLTVKKANYGPANVELRLRWQGGVFAAEEGAATSMSGLELQAAEARVERMFLELLTAYDAQGRNVGHQPGPTYAPAVFAKDPAAAGIKAAGFTAAMNRLFAAHAIKVETTGPASKRRSRLVRQLESAAE